jgi:hypothetical protein
MSVISPELGVCAFEGWVAVGFRLLDAVEVEGMVSYVMGAQLM